MSIGNRLTLGKLFSLLHAYRLSVWTVCIESVSFFKMIQTFKGPLRQQGPDHRPDPDHDPDHTKRLSLGAIKQNHRHMQLIPYKADRVCWQGAVDLPTSKELFTEE